MVVSRPESIDAGRQRIAASLNRAVGKGKPTEAEGAAALGRATLTPHLEELADGQFVIESIREDEVAKAGIFERLDKILEDPEAILASNTSSIPIMRLARCTTREERVIGVHFFSPAPVLPLVEVTASLLTDGAVADRVEHFVTEVLGKRAIRSPDRTGFVVNSLLIPYLLSAIRMVRRNGRCPCGCGVSPPAGAPPVGVLGARFGCQGWVSRCPSWSRRMPHSARNAPSTASGLRPMRHPWTATSCGPSSLRQHLCGARHTSECGSIT